MHSEITLDGWVARRMGKGIVLRRNPAHVERVLEALRRRFDAETEIRVTDNA